jgi:hypothetical protein
MGLYLIGPRRPRDSDLAGRRRPGAGHTAPPAKLEFPLAGYRINALDSSPTNVVCVF